MIVQRPYKMRIKEVEELSQTSQSFRNLAFDKRFPSIDKMIDSMYDDTDYEIIHTLYGSGSVRNFNKPNVTMRGYESNPGAWVFDDTDTGITWIIFSDCHKKYHFKGTSYELILPPGITNEQLLNSTIAMFKLVGIDIVVNTGGLYGFKIYDQV